MAHFARSLLLVVYSFAFVLSLWWTWKMVQVLEPRDLTHPGAWAATFVFMEAMLATAMLRQARARRPMIRDAALIVIAAGLLLLVALAHLRPERYNVYGALHIAVAVVYFVHAFWTRRGRPRRPRAE